MSTLEAPASAGAFYIQKYLLYKNARRKPAGRERTERAISGCSCRASSSAAPDARDSTRGSPDNHASAGAAADRGNTAGTNTRNGSPAAGRTVRSCTGPRPRAPPTRGSERAQHRAMQHLQQGWQNSFNLLSVVDGLLEPRATIQHQPLSVKRSRESGTAFAVLSSTHPSE